MKVQFNTSYFLDVHALSQQYSLGVMLLATVILAIYVLWFNVQVGLERVAFAQLLGWHFFVASNDFLLPD